MSHRWLATMEESIEWGRISMALLHIYIKSSLFSASVLVRRKVVLLCVVHSIGIAFAFGSCLDL